MPQQVPASAPVAAGQVPTGTAVVCCYTADRWDRLVAACASVQAQTRPVDLVVVVDHHPDLARRLRALPALAADSRVRVLENVHEQGISGARTTGVEAAGTQVVLFLDDDAVADPDWALGLLGPFVDAAVMVAGGRVEPDWEGGAPAWFPAELGWVVGCSHTGQPSGRARVRNPIGASMAVRREVFERVGRFSTAIGRRGSLPAGCEETELCLRLAAADPGAVVLLEPASVVRHHVPVARQSVRYALRRGWHEGRSKAVVSRLAADAAAAGSSRPALCSESAYLRRTVPAALARHGRRALAGSRPDAVAAAMLAGVVTATVAGYVTGRAVDLRR